MSFGILTSKTKNPDGTFNGTLTDLETQAKYTFSKEPDLRGVNEPDVVNYTDMGNGVAGKLSPNLNVKLTAMDTASQDTKLAFNNLLKAMAKDSNQTTVIAKKI